MEEKMPDGAEPESDRAKSPVYLRYVRRDPARLVFAEQLGCRTPTRQPNDGFLRFKDNRRNGGLDHGQTVRFDFSNAVEHRQQLCLKPTQLRTGWPRHRRYYGPAV